MQSSVGSSGLPAELQLHLRMMGVIDKPKEETPLKPEPVYVAWKPSFVGEEPPF